LPSIALTALSALVAVLGAEWIAGEFARDPAQREAARLGIGWDSRDRLEVIMDKRQADPNWFPAIPANTYLERPILLEGKRIVPLGGVANAHVVGCNENGYYSTFSTDERGLNNPAVHGAPPNQRVFFLGDSFTQGDCLRPGETLVDRVRSVRPDIVNLGSGGNGPLFQLAGIREYIESGEVHVALWMYYEGNDLDDLVRDSGDAILIRYLDKAFSQGLAPRQAEVNAAVRAMVEGRLHERWLGRSRVLPNLRNLLWQVRQQVGGRLEASRDAAQGSSDATSSVALFLEVIALARDEVAEKGGTLLFVYLPEYQRYSWGQLSKGARQRDAVLTGVRKLGIPVVDIDEAFRRQPEPLDHFPLGLKGHYDADGAAVASRAILVALEAARI